MIFIGSRYENQEVTYILDGRSETTRPTVLRTGTGTPNYRSFVHWNDAYRLDQVANRVVADPQRWWSVMDVNAEILNPWAIQSGTRVNLP